MRTKKAVVHGKHSRKRNNHVGSSYSNKNNSDTSKRHRNHTMKGGMDILIRAGRAGRAIRNLPRRIEDKFSGCAVSSKMFENTNCFEEELTKKINEAVSQFVITNLKGEGVGSKVPEDLRNDRKELFTTIKRVLFPLLVNVMIMRENGKLLDNVQWDLGYSTLVTIIILKFIESSIYKVAVRGNLVDFTVFTNQGELKELEKCLENESCSKLSPSSLSQILYYFFIENDTKKSANFRGNLILRVKEYANDYKIKQRGGAYDIINDPPLYAAMTSPAPVQEPAPNPNPPPAPPPVQEPTPEQNPTPGSSPNPDPEQNSSPPPPVPNTPRPNQKPKNLDILYSVAFPIEENRIKAINFLEALNKIYQGEGEGNELEPDTFNKFLRFSLDDENKLPTFGSRVTLFNICMNIYSSEMFNTGTNLSDINIERALVVHGITRIQSKSKTEGKLCLSHEDHLLCVGKMPEYLTEFDIPKQFQHKEKSIDEMGWGQTEFAKLKLVVFTEPDIGVIQVGGSQPGSPNVPRLPAYTGAPPNNSSESSVETPNVSRRLPAYTGAPPNNSSESSVETPNVPRLPAYTGAPPNNSSDSDSSQSRDSKTQYLGAPSYTSSPATSVNTGSVRSNISLPISAEHAVNPFYESGSNQGNLNTYPNTGYTGLRGNPGKVQTPSNSNEIYNTLKQEKQDYNPKVFSIHQRTDKSEGNMDKYLKKGEYFVKFRVPSLIKDKINKSGSDRVGVLGGKTTKIEKRMAFHYPIRFGPTFSKFVSLMLNGSSYYKSLEQAGHDIDKLVDMYRAYENAQKNCDPKQLKVLINRPNVPPNPRPSGPVLPERPSGPEGGNIDPDTADLLASLTPDLQALILQIIRENPEKKFNNRALVQMIYELISALRISKFESETGGGTDGGGNDGGNSDNNNKGYKTKYEALLKYFNELLKKTEENTGKLKKNIESLLVIIKQLESEKANLEALLKRAEHENKETIQFLNEEADVLRATIAELEQKLVNIQGENEELRGELEALTVLYQQSIDENNDLLRENKEIAAQMRDNAARVATLEQQLEESQRTIKRLQGIISNLREDLEREKTSNSDLQARLAELETELQSAQNRLRESNARIAELEAELNEQHAEFEQTMTQTHGRNLEQQRKLERDLAMLSEQNGVLISENNELRQALKACEEEKAQLQVANDDLQRQLEECKTDKGAGGGPSHDRDRGPRRRNQGDLVITEQLKTNICFTMKRLLEQNPQLYSDLSNQIIIHNNGTYRQITYSDVVNQCTIKEGRGTFKSAPSVSIPRLEVNKKTPLIFSTQTGKIDVQAMLVVYNTAKAKANLGINYKKHDATVPLKYEGEGESATLTIRPGFFPTRRGGTRTKKLNRVNKSRKKSKKINF